MQKLIKNINGYDVSLSFVDVAPELASEILSRLNTKNRKENKNHTTALLRNMEKGTWRFNGDTICFDAEGSLIDGQHRLSAIAKSGKTTTCLFVEGLNPDAIKTKDMEIKPRNLSDLFRMDNIANGNCVASVITRYFAFHCGRTGISYDKAGSVGRGIAGGLNTLITFEQRYNFYYENADVVEEAVGYGMNLYSQSRLLTVSEIGGLYLYLFFDKHHSDDEIKGFFDGLVYNSEVNVINILRNKLIIDKGAIRKLASPHKQALIAKTWNYYITGKDVKVLSYNPALEGTIEFI